MYKYWIKEIPLTSNLKKNINLLIKNPTIFKKEETKELIITHNGYYSLNENYILQNNNNNFQMIKDYLENYTLLINKINLNKRKNIIMKIPFNHQKITQKIVKLSFEKKTNTYLNIDFTNNKLTDFYFTSSLNYENYNLKNNIGSFLSRLM
ncbi:MAG: hypothetical protein CML42_07465 [Rhodobacteraceae bacterium]|nr:hypothetical protein [Paracoccaceae bacterium]|tara:strand:+ start:20923 stop:21375 length:453 start_codon:yes stop_codon:yes gene_type:complete